MSRVAVEGRQSARGKRNQTTSHFGASHSGSDSSKVAADVVTARQAALLAKRSKRVEGLKRLGFDGVDGRPAIEKVLELEAAIEDGTLEATDKMLLGMID